MSPPRELFHLRSARGAQQFLHPIASKNQRAEIKNGRQRMLPAIDGELLRNS
jgi:hypothetical protein